MVHPGEQELLLFDQICTFAIMDSNEHRFILSKSREDLFNSIDPANDTFNTFLPKEDSTTITGDYKNKSLIDTSVHSNTLPPNSMDHIVEQSNNRFENRIHVRNDYSRNAFLNLVNWNGIHQLEDYVNYRS